MPTGANTHPAFPQHEDPAASQPSLWTPAPSVLTPRHSVLGTWLRPGTFHASRCAPLRARTFDAVGDRISVPLRAGCPHRRERKDAMWTERNGDPIMVESHPAATG